jgi:hypothetical protein
VIRFDIKVESSTDEAIGQFHVASLFDGCRIGLCAGDLRLAGQTHLDGIKQTQQNKKERANL